jgi:hypothetical protein
VISDPGQHVGEPGLWIDVVELGSLDQGQHDRGAFAATIGPGERQCLAAECNLEVILPISGRMSLSTIAGIRCAGKMRVAFSWTLSRNRLSDSLCSQSRASGRGMDLVHVPTSRNRFATMAHARAVLDV